MSVPIDRELRLASGRRLAYREWGPREGRALVFMHGTPGSRLCFGPDDAIVAMPGLRVITIDRPGYGRSDPEPTRTLSSWALDVRELADALALDRFAVAGVSGGGPHALACAQGLPERVCVALVLACPAPLGSLASLDELAFGNRLGIWLDGRAPRLLAKLIEINAAAFARDRAAYMRSLAQQMPAPDRKLLDDPRLRAAILDDIAEGYRQGPAGQVVDGRLALTARAWDFELADIRVPVHLWHGELDRLVTRSMADALASAIPGARLRIVEGAGHLISEDPRCVAEFHAALASALG